MGISRVLLAFFTAPLTVSTAFFPGGINVLRQSWTNTHTNTNTRTSVAVTALASGFSMEMEAGHDAGSREQFLRQAAAAAASVGVTAAGLSFGADSALADSTGKYSSKATAKKRYLPRIAKAVKGFEQLRKDINSGSASGTSAFFVDVLPDAVSAMDLYGSSMKKGELPDSKSRALQQLAQDFGGATTVIAKSLAKSGGESVKAYDNAAKILEQYLKGTELDPIGSPSYN